MNDRASGVERIAIIEAIEETGNVLFSEILPLAQTLETRLGVELRYCGSHHFDLESGHSAGSEHRAIAAIAIDKTTQARCLKFAEDVFDAFTAWTHELLRYAQAHPPVMALYPANDAAAQPRRLPGEAPPALY